MKIKQLAVSLNNKNSVNIYNLSKRFAVFICLICVFQLMASNKFLEKNIGIDMEYTSLEKVIKQNKKQTEHYGLENNEVSGITEEFYLCAINEDTRTELVGNYANDANSKTPTVSYSFEDLNIPFKN